MKGAMQKQFLLLPIIMIIIIIIANIITDVFLKISERLLKLGLVHL